MQKAAEPHINIPMHPALVREIQRNFEYHNDTVTRLDAAGRLLTIKLAGKDYNCMQRAVQLKIPGVSKIVALSHLVLALNGLFLKKGQLVNYIDGNHGNCLLSNLEIVDSGKFMRKRAKWASSGYRHVYKGAKGFYCVKIHREGVVYQRSVKELKDAVDVANMLRIEHDGADALIETYIEPTKGADMSESFISAKNIVVPSTKDTTVSPAKPTRAAPKRHSRKELSDMFPSQKVLKNLFEYRDNKLYTIGKINRTAKIGEPAGYLFRNELYRIHCMGQSLAAFKIVARMFGVEELDQVSFSGAYGSYEIPLDNIYFHKGPYYPLTLPQWLAARDNNTAEPAIIEAPQINTPVADVADIIDKATDAEILIIHTSNAAIKTVGEIDAMILKLSEQKKQLEFEVKKLNMERMVRVERALIEMGAVYSIQIGDVSYTSAGESV